MTEIPFVTVILPIRNEVAYKRKLIHDFSALHPQPQIHILKNPDKIVPTGINNALREAKGEIIIRLYVHL